MWVFTESPDLATHPGVRLLGWLNLPRGRRQEQPHTLFPSRYTIPNCLLQPPPHKGRGASGWRQLPTRPFALPQSKAPSPLPAYPILSSGTPWTLRAGAMHPNSSPIHRRLLECLSVGAVLVCEPLTQGPAPAALDLLGYALLTELRRGVGILSRKFGSTELWVATSRCATTAKRRAGLPLPRVRRLLSAVAIGRGVYLLWPVG